MKVLTVQQPWAWGLIFGPKRIENRTWPTKYRGPLLIHAAKSKLRMDAAGVFPSLPEKIEYGSIIGICNLVDCVPVAKVEDQLFAEGPWCWVIDNPRPTQPHACKGMLGLWELAAAPDYLTQAACV